MPLLAYNLTAAPLLLAAGAPPVTLSSSGSPGSRGPAFNVTGNMKALPAIGGFDLLQAQVAAGSCEYEWTNLPEFNTFTLVVGSAQEDVAEADVILFVTTAGNDNNPGTAALPLLTIDAAIGKCPMGWKKQLRINIGLGNFVLNSLGSNFGSGVGSDWTPPVIIGTPADQIGPQVAAGASTDIAYVCTVDPVIADGFLRGAYLRNTTTGARGLVTDNLTVLGVCTVYLLEPGLFATPGDGFVVERPGTVIQIPPFNTAGFSSACGILGFRDVKFQASAPGGFLVDLVAFVTANLFACEAVEFEGGADDRGFFMANSASLFSGGAPAFWESLGVNNPFSVDRLLAGIYQSGSFEAAFSLLKQARLQGYFVWDNALLFVQSQGLVDISNYNARTFGINASVNSAVVVNNGTHDGSPIFTQADGYSINNSLARLGLDAALTIGGCAGSAIQGGREAQIQTANVFQGPNPNGTFGIRVRRISQCVRGGAETVTGGTADTVVGSVNRSYAQLPFSETALTTFSTGAAAAIGATNNVTGLTGMTLADVGSQLAITGSGTPANNDTHLIIKFVSATEVVVASVLVVDAGPVSWSLKANRPTLNRIQ